MPAKFTLPDSIYSRDQLVLISEELFEVAGLIAQQERKKEYPKLPTLSPEVGELLRGLEAAKVSSEAVEEVRTNIERAGSWPVLHLALAGVPSSQLRGELIAWVRRSIHPEVLVEFQLNPDIGGGVVIRTTNRVFDCSFRSQILASPETFTRVLERV